MITPPIMNFTKGSHCGWCGTRFAEQITYPRKCFRCGNDTYVNPIPVSVALIPMWHDHNELHQAGILITKRNIEPKKGQWALPGGYLDMGETWQKGCAREVFEEVGLETDPENYELFGVELAMNGNLLVFGLYKGFKTYEDINFVPNEETSSIDLAYTPAELAFPTHTAALNKWLSND